MYPIYTLIYTEDLSAFGRQHKAQLITATGQGRKKGEVAAM